MKKLTKEQAVVLSAFTGVLMCELDDYYAFVQKAVGCPVLTHEVATPHIQRIVKAAALPQFREMLPVETEGRDPE